MSGPKRPVIWSRNARDDLRNIWNYYVQAAGEDTADNVARAINKACFLLEDHPFAGRDRREVQAGLRSIVARPHVVFYRINPSGITEVVRVLDGRLDLEKIFHR